MSPSSCDSDSGLAILGRCLEELGGPGDRLEVVARYCRLYPDLAEQVRALAEVGALLGEIDPAGPEAPLPESIGPYRVLRRIGRGGMGEVYEAVEMPLNRRVAVKTIRRGHDTRPDLMDRFRRERRALARLHHTHIVPIFAAGRAGPLLYFAMPFIRGVALSQVIQAIRRRGVPESGSSPTSLAALARGLPEGLDSPSRPSEWAPSPLYVRSVARAMADVAEAIHHAHRRGIVHRDLKPSNLMIDTSGHCWVLDFGLAALSSRRDERVAAEGPAPRLGDATDGQWKGTPEYMAPEQHHAGARPDPRIDVWGLGATLHELLTLDRASQAVEDQPWGRWRGVPHELEAICRKALRHEPGQRYQSSRALARDLRRWLRQEPVEALPARPLRRAELWARRNRGWASALAVLVLATIALGAGGTIFESMRAAKSRADAQAARTSAEAARTGERLQRRQSLLERIIRLRLTTHSEGWSDQVWQLAQQAARLDGVPDTGLQAHAAASLQGLDARIVRYFTGFGASALAFDPAGQMLLMGDVTAAGDHTRPLNARLWDDRRQDLATLATTGYGPVGFRPDGSPVQLLTADDSALSLVDLARNKVVRRFEVPGRLDRTGAERPALGMLPDASLVGASIRQVDGTLALAVWDGESGALLRRISGRPLCVAFTPDRALAAVGDDAGRINVWSLATGREVAAIDGGRNAIRCLAFQRDPLRRGAAEGLGPGQSWLLAAGAGGGTVTVWDLGARLPRSRCPGSAWDIYAVTFSPDGTLLASAGRTEVHLWDVATGRLALALRGGNYITALAFTSDGRRLAVGCPQAYDHSGSVRLWELSDGRGLRTLRGLSAYVEKTVVSPDGRLVAGLSHDWRVGIWSLESGRLLHLLDVPRGHFADNAGLAFRSDGRRFAFAAGREAVLWDVDTGREIGSWSLPSGFQDNLIFVGPEDLVLARAEAPLRLIPPDRDHPFKERPISLRLRRLRAGGRIETVCSIEEFPTDIYLAGFSPDGKWLVVDGCGPDGQARAIRLYEAATGRFVRTISQPRTSAHATFLFDTTGTIFSDRDEPPFEHAHLELPGGRVVGHTEVRPLCLGPRGERWISWKPPSLGEPALLRFHERGRSRPLLRIALDVVRMGRVLQFSPDGRHVVWGQPDGTVIVCNLGEVQERLVAAGLLR